MKYQNIREEELKNKVGSDFFADFDTTEILGNIDFSVFPKQQELFGSRTPLLRAEAKTGDYDVPTMFVQLILTIGKARTFDKILPPAFLGAFDFKKIAFIEYIAIQDIFYENDFNWNVTPSNHETREFKLLYSRVQDILKQKSLTFDYLQQEKQLKDFIKNNIAQSKNSSKIKINKNNFLSIYRRWSEIVQPLIDVNRDQLKQANITDSDFFLADLFVDDHNTTNINDDESIKDDLFVIFENGSYKIEKANLGQIFDANIPIRNKNTYELFWKNYKRPPLKEYQEYIIQRRDLLIHQDIRERKGAFFTPRIRVELSQKYMADYFGDNYQDDYYIRDCAAGTGNLLAGLTNKYNIYASTLQTADVLVMKDMVKANTANLLEDHIFQFDFLNDSFDKLPPSLQDIINDPEKRKKLIIYINPPYAEATNAKTITGTGVNKTGTATGTIIHQKYAKEMGKARNELFVQFFCRIYKEIPNCKLAEFSKLKILQAENFLEFRKTFRTRPKKMFIVPANTFDNVKGDFPIGFKIRNLEDNEDITQETGDIFNKNSEYLGEKIIYGNLPTRINKWIKSFDNKDVEGIGFIGNASPDFQHSSQVYISKNKGKEHFNFFNIRKESLLHASIYLAVRHCIPADWLNDRDQFLRPKDARKQDTEFQTDCLIFTLFHGQNRITSREGTNHRIPFREAEVDAKERFASSFMADFLNTKMRSPEAEAVYQAGKVLRTYYHTQTFQSGTYLANASLYEIKEYFQGRDEKTGKMNNKSSDETYNQLISNLREKLKTLANKIADKVYEYEFLKR